MRKLWMILLVFIVSCNDSDHFSYERIEGSIHYKLIAVGDESRPVEKADHLTMRLCIIDANDTIAIKEFNRVNKAKSVFPKYFSHLLNSAHEGDEISILGASNELQLNALLGRQIKDSSYQETVQIELLIAEALTDDQLRDAKARERLKRDIELKEISEMAKVKDSLNLGEDDFYDGIYIRFLNEVEGPKVKAGDYVKTHYSAVLLNGKEIDNNFDHEPFEYEIGKPDQVIPGFAIGMSQMTLGREALFVIPPRFAFGNRGSSSGIVTPGSMIIYHVKLEEIN